jgi:hypothetical protein
MATNQASGQAGARRVRAGPARRALSWLLLGVLALGTVAGGWAGWRFFRMPLEYVEREIPVLTLSDEETYYYKGFIGDRAFHDLTLVAKGVEPIRITISLPRNLPPDPMPVVVVLGGHRTGRRNLKHIPAPGPNVVIGIDYPHAAELKQADTAFERFVAARRTAFAVPSQVVAMLRWVGAREWADPRRISLLGYSLGALFVPAIHRMAQVQGMQLGPGILAYGGADLFNILRANLHWGPEWARGILAFLGALWLRPVDPAAHLPYLKGEFLLINSEGGDIFIPDAAVRALHQLMPEPKASVALPGGHIDPRDAQLLRQVVKISRDWLLERGAVNPWASPAP